MSYTASTFCPAAQIRSLCIRLLRGCIRPVLCKGDLNCVPKCIETVVISRCTLHSCNKSKAKQRQGSWFQITFISNLRQISNYSIWKLHRDLQHWPVSDLWCLVPQLVHLDWVFFNIRSPSCKALIEFRPPTITVYCTSFRLLELRPLGAVVV